MCHCILDRQSWKVRIISSHNSEKGVRIKRLRTTALYVGCPTPVAPSFESQRSQGCVELCGDVADVELLSGIFYQSLDLLAMCGSI